jgi:putative ABC transport system permease protein
MHGFWQDVRFGLRALLRRPGFTLVILLALGGGIGANTAMFSILNAALFRPLPFPEPQRLVFGYTVFGGGGGFGLVSAPDYFDCREQAQAFESLSAMLGFETQSTVQAGDEPERVNSAVVSVDLFGTLGASPLLGRAFTAEEAKPGAPAVAVVSHEYWSHRLGGAPEAVGSTLRIDGNPVTIVGVMPPGFRIRSDNDLWFPMVDDPGSQLPRHMHNWYMVGRLKPGVSLEEARGQVDVIARRLEEQYPETNRRKGFGLVSLQVALVRSDRASLLALMGALALVLLIACANVAGLLLARGCARRQELAVRAALGASRARLVRQLLTESTILALLAASLALLSASWLQAILLRVTPIESLGGREVPLDSRVLLFTLAVSTGTALLFGLVPALRSGRANPAVDLHAGARTTDSRAGTRLRSVLIAAQVALSVVLLIGSGLLIRSLAHLRGVDLGFRPERMVTAEIQLPGSRYPDLARRAGFASTLIERLRAQPGVEGAGLISLLPVREPRNNVRAWAADAPPSDLSQAEGTFIRGVLPGYFEAMGIPLLLGRDIQEADRDGTTEVTVINQSMASALFPDRSPLGREVVIDYPGVGPTHAQVVGVVGNVHQGGPAFAPSSVSYASYFQRQPDAEMQVAVRTTGDPAAGVGLLRAVVRELDPEVPLSDVATMGHFIGRRLSDCRTMAGLLSAFALVAVLLAGLGLFGMLAFYVEQRTREIGVRMALGAAHRQVLAMVVRRGMALVLVGLAAGLPGSWLAARLLGHLLHDVSPADPGTLAASSIAFLAVALVACWIPARRATRVDPTLPLSAE